MKIEDIFKEQLKNKMRSQTVKEVGSGSKTVIGIDLGTTNSCAAVYNKDKKRVDVLESIEGGDLIPSFVSFKRKERVIGKTAKAERKFNPKNTVFEVKRLIGRKITDKEIQDDLKHWPFKVIEEESVEEGGKTGRPIISVQFRNEEQKFTPEQISGFLLSKISADAQEKLRKDTKDVVITVPAYFNNSQRQATKDAGKLALLNVVGMINEPTAAALAYGLDNKSEQESRILVYDLGGGTFDLSILSSKNGKFQVIATNGNTHLGGGDFDKKIFEFALENFPEYTEKINSNPRIKMDLMDECILAKETLSTSESATIHLNIDLANQISEECDITREEFEKICKKDFDSTIVLLDQILKDAKMTKNDINKVILVGGSTRIPYIKNLVADYFGYDKVDISKNPDRIVAIGAAIYGAKIENVKDNEIETISFQDITPLSMGIEITSGELSVVVKRNSPIPLSKVKEFTNELDNQKSVLIQIFEGEEKIAKDNHFLGNFVLKGLTPMPAGENKIDVKFNIDEKGILIVTATERSTGKNANILIKNSSMLSNKKIDEYVKQSEKFKEEDKNARDLSIEVQNLKKRCREIKIKIKNQGDNGSNNLSSLKSRIENIENLLRDQDADHSIEEIKQMLKSINEMAQRVFG